MDEFIGQIVNILDNAKLLETGHVIVTSTPGYVDVKLTNLITLMDDIEAENSYVISGHSPVLNIKSEGEFIYTLLVATKEILQGCVNPAPFTQDRTNNFGLYFAHWLALVILNALQMPLESTRV